MRKSFGEHLWEWKCKKLLKGTYRNSIQIEYSEIHDEWDKDEPVSYKKLFESLFRDQNVKIDKTAQLADFRIRPLDRISEYLAKDVDFLLLAFWELKKG